MSKKITSFFKPKGANDVPADAESSNTLSDDLDQEVEILSESSESDENMPPPSRSSCP